MSPDASGAISREGQRMVLAADLVSDLSDAAAAGTLMSCGLRWMLHDGLAIGSRHADAVMYFSRYLHDMTERVHALLHNKPCRWLAGQTGEEVAAVDAEPVP